MVADRTTNLPPRPPPAPVPAPPAGLPLTRVTLLGNLADADPARRDAAWAQFHRVYAPVIRSFALSLRLDANAVDAVTQEVMVGFFGTSPRFRYDPEKGRFRGYLLRCTTRAVSKHLRERAAGGENVGHRPVSLTGAPDAADPAVAEAWEQAWRRERARLVRDAVVSRAGGSKMFRAFALVMLESRPVAAVAEDLGMTPNAVHQATSRVSRMLREEFAALDE